MPLGRVGDEDEAKSTADETSSSTTDTATSDPGGDVIEERKETTDQEDRTGRDGETDIGADTGKESATDTSSETDTATTDLGDDIIEKRKETTDPEDRTARDADDAMTTEPDDGSVDGGTVDDDDTRQPGSGPGGYTPAVGDDTTDPDNVTPAPELDTYDDPGEYVEDATEYQFDDVDDGEIYTTRTAGRIEPRFTERGARQAVASLLNGVDPDSVTLGAAGATGYTIDDIVDAAEARAEAAQTDAKQLADVGQSRLQEARKVEAFEAAQETERRADNVQQRPLRGNYGDPQDIRRERAAESLSTQLGFDVTADDVTLEDTGDGYIVQLSERAQRAATLSASAEFLRRDAEIERTETGGFQVSLPGDNPAVERALTRRVQGREAFGGETTVSFLGQTLNVDQLTADIAGAVEGGAETAGDFADRANLFNPARPAFVNPEGIDQSVVGADTPTEAGADYMIQALEGGVTGLGEVPRDTLELGEAAVSPLAWRAAGDVAMMGARRLDDIDVESAQDVAEGTAETAGRLNVLARENPEAATAASASLLGGAAVTLGTYAGASAVLTRLGSASPRAARTGEFLLDPVRVTGETAVSGAARARRAAPSIDIGDRLRLQQFRSDTRAMAQLTGRQQTDGEVDSEQDTDLGVPADDPFRVSDRRLYDPARTFDDPNEPSVDIDPTERSGVAEQDIGQGVASQGDPQAAPGSDFTWDVGDSAAIRREAESPNVETDAGDFGDLIRTARRQDTFEDARTGGVLTLDPETTDLLTRAAAREAQTTAPGPRLDDRAALGETRRLQPWSDSATTATTQFGRQTTMQWEATATAQEPVGDGPDPTTTEARRPEDTPRASRSAWPDLDEDEQARPTGDGTEPQPDGESAAFDNLPGAGWLNVYKVALAGGGIEARSDPENIDALADDDLGVSLPTQGQVDPSEDLTGGLEAVEGLFFLDDGDGGTGNDDGDEFLGGWL